MKTENHDEMMERFRLYGEICILCDEKGIDIDNFIIDRDELECDCEIEQAFDVVCDDGEQGKLNCITFDSGMLYVGYDNQDVQFIDVSSETLRNVLFIFESINYIPR